MFDWTVNFGHVLTVAAFVGSVGIGVITLRGQVRDMAHRMLGVETEMKKLVEILVGQARQEERMNSLDARMVIHAQRMSEIDRQVDRLFEPGVTVSSIGKRG